MAGVFQVDREIFDNRIWQNPAEFRLFFYILGNAIWSEEGVKYGDILIQRGQYLRSYRNLREDLMYTKNNAFKYYSLSHIKKLIDKLVADGRLEKEETDLGTLFTVVNYCKYQGFDRFENVDQEQIKNGERTEQEQNKNNNKKDKKDKKVNNKDICTDIEEEIPDEKPKKPKPKKDKYGEFEKVSLTNDEFNKLLDKLGQARIKEMIARLDTYKASTGKRYSSDYATILNWHRKDVDEGKYNDKTQQSKPKSQQKQSNLTDLLNMIEEGAFDE